MAVDPVYNSSLSKTQKTLFVLWHEWEEIGIAGRKKHYILISFTVYIITSLLYSHYMIACITWYIMAIYTYKLYLRYIFYLCGCM